MPRKIHFRTSLNSDFLAVYPVNQPCPRLPLREKLLCWGPNCRRSMLLFGDLVEFFLSQMLVLVFPLPFLGAVAPDPVRKIPHTGM